MTAHLTGNETQFILAKVRKNLDHATGAHYCECVTDHGPASGFRKEKKPDCAKCDWTGLIKNPGWDGTREQFDHLKKSIVASSGAGTAFVDPDDGVGPGKECYGYSTSSKGIRLYKGYESNGTLTRDVTMSWPSILDALMSGPEPAQLDLFAGAVAR